MSQQLNGHVLTLDAGEALSEDRLVRMDGSGNAVYCDAGEDFIGKTRTNVASGDPIGVLLPGEIGTWKLTAAAAISARATVYTAADGKVSSAPSGTRVGIAMQAATGDGSKLEVLPNCDATLAADSGIVTNYLAGEALAVNRLVKLHTDGTILYAAAGQEAIGLTLAAIANGAAGPIRLVGTLVRFTAVASEAIPVGAVVYTAAAGKVADTSSATRIGIAATVAGADNATLTVIYSPAIT